MPTRYVKRTKKEWIPPGSLVYMGETAFQRVRITLLDYNDKELVEKEIERVEDCLPYIKNPSTTTWINITGLSDPKLIEEIGKTFGINNFWLEDLLNTDHRPKAEELEGLLFLLIRSAAIDQRNSGHVIFNQIGLFLGEKFVFSFQERPMEVFGTIKERIEKSKGRIRLLKADYRFYALIDCVVDSYYVVLEKTGAEIETLEPLVAEKPSFDVLKRIHKLKSEILFLRKSALPLRDSIGEVAQNPREDIEQRTLLYLNDCFEHSAQIVDIVDNYKEILSGLLEVYLSSVNQKTNEVMKILTMFSALFIPLTFIVGIYGMNFENMPELRWHYGYYFCWGIMLTVISSLVVFFKRKRWF